jgi:hypothetical protein
LLLPKPRVAAERTLPVILKNQKVEKEEIKGEFEVIDSFAIRSRNEFYLIGEIREGIVEVNWFLNIPFNQSLSLTVRIKSIEEVEISSESKKYKLIVVNADSELLNLLLGLHIGSEYLNITIEGQD